MENEANLTADKAGRLTSPTYFSPSEHFLGIAGQIASSHSGALISLPAAGEVLLLPQQGIYVAYVPDMRAFCQAPAASFKVSHPHKDDHARLAAAGVTGRIPELLWEAAFHASQGRLIGSHSTDDEVHVYDVVRFRHWPNLTRLSQTANTMRICALLTRQPSSIMLVSRKLGIEPSEVYQVYSAACSYGVVKVVSNNLARTGGENEEGDSHSAANQSQGLMKALLAKIAGL